jgi:hypothetical protein
LKGRILYTLYAPGTRRPRSAVSAGRLSNTVDGGKTEERDLAIWCGSSFLKVVVSLLLCVDILEPHQPRNSICQQAQLVEFVDDLPSRLHVAERIPMSVNDIV